MYNTQFRNYNEEGTSFGRYTPSYSCAFFIVFFKLKAEEKFLKFKT